jgi:hypothetical protein
MALSGLNRRHAVRPEPLASGRNCPKVGAYRLGDRMTIFSFGGGLIILGFFFAVREAGDGVAVGVNAGGLIAWRFCCDRGVGFGDYV